MGSGSTSKPSVCSPGSVDVTQAHRSQPWFLYKRLLGIQLSGEVSVGACAHTLTSWEAGMCQDVSSSLFLLNLV